MAPRNPHPGGTNASTTNDATLVGLPGPEVPGDRFQQVVATLRRWGRVDRTTSITGLAVALQLREQLGETVPLRRPVETAVTDVIVDDSIGVVVVQDPGGPTEELSADRLTGVDHLVVYANAAVDTCKDAWKRFRSNLSVAELGLSRVSFVGGPESC